MKKLWSIVAGFFIGLFVSNRYEAGQRWSTGRSYLPGFVQDARYDADPATRDELVRKSRYFERNSAIVNRLVDLFEQYTVGPHGLQFIPASSDEEWNQANAAAWAQWCQFADLVSRQHFSTLQSLIARAWFIDGEVFLLKTHGELVGRDSVEPGQPRNRPRVQLIESHRVSTPSQLQTQEGTTLIEGIEVDRRGRPVAYHIQDGLAGDTWKRVPADMVIHIFEPARPGQYRGLPFLYPVLNDLHDLDDLQLLTAQVARKLASLSEVIENEGGEAPDPETLRRARYGQTTQTTAGTDTEENRTAFYKQQFGARTAYLKRGDKLNRPDMNRPSVAEREYWDYLLAKVCAGVGISKLLVFPYSVQGTVTRADLDAQNTFFRSRSAVLQAAFTQVYLWVTDWNIKNLVEVSDPPADWRAVTTRAPRSVNVDVGRNSSAMINELNAGLRTFESCFAEFGLDWRTELRQRAKEEAFINDAAKEFGVEPARIREVLVKQLQTEKAAAPAPEEVAA